MAIRKNQNKHQGGGKHSKKPASLANGRPPTAKKAQPSFSKKTTKKLIRSHHQLNKQKSIAEAKGDKEGADELDKQINDLGGLESYQLASVQGQANDRGGDSSQVLMEWLKDVKPTTGTLNPGIRMLEVGALSTKNACSKSGLFDMTRIDLNSQAEGIDKQDFMERPVPRYDKDQFDVISLSLVLNFVPSIPGRGEMLKRTCQFLDQRAPRTMPVSLQGIFPALFLVLPASCVTNSRYMSEERLTLMMSSLGFVLLNRKETSKLIYYLWQLRDRPTPDGQNFQKQLLKTGGDRNNFSIILQNRKA